MLEVMKGFFFEVLGRSIEWNFAVHVFVLFGSVIDEVIVKIRWLWRCIQRAIFVRHISFS